MIFPTSTSIPAQASLKLRLSILALLLLPFLPTILFGQEYSFSWTANPEPVEGYRLYYKKGGEATAPYDGIDAAEGISPISIGKQTTYKITGLDGSSSYHFVLTAYNGEEESDFTAPITTTPSNTETTAEVTAPGELTTDNVYSFSWAANPEPVDGYKLYYKLGGEAVAPFDGTDATEGASPIDVGKQTNFTVTGLDNTATYHFALTAYLNTVESELTPAITISQDTTATDTTTTDTSTTDTSTTDTSTTDTTTTDTTTTDTTTTDTTTTGTSTTDTTRTDVTGTYTFTWTANPEPVEGYKLYYKKGGDPEIPFDGTDANEGVSPINVGKQTTFSLTGLDDAAIYHFALTAYNGTDESDFTTPITTGTPDQITPVEPTGDGTYSFTWNANPDPVEGYKIYYKKGGDPVIPFDGTEAIEGSSPVDVGNLTSYTLTGLDPTATYHFALSAYNGTAESKLTTPITISPDTSTTTPLSAIIAVSSQSGEAPLSVSFDGSGSKGSIDTYNWQFGDGESSTGATVAHAYQFAGTYTAILTINDIEGQSHQSSIDITATEPVSTTPPEDPIAVISSTNAVGDAPLSVDFDGSESSSQQPPITGYAWYFGDGSGSTGPTTSHNYQIPGDYQANLTVTDNIGLTGTTNTPVLVTESPNTIVNEPPIASFTATPTSGTSPLTVNFDASGSSDQDGTITSYSWRLGDGSTSTGVTLSHTYSDIADYTVTLIVTDDKSETSSTSKTISVQEPDTTEFYFELWEVQIDHNWALVTFDRQFTEPVIIAGPPGNNDPDPTTIRIRNVTQNGFEIRLQEYDYQDDIHGFEPLTFMVMEKGLYELEDGTRIEAGTFKATTSSQKHTLQHDYTITPVILTQIVTNNEADAVVGRIYNVSPTEFEFVLQEEENNRTGHAEENVAYIALEAGTGQIVGHTYEAGFSPQDIDHNWLEMKFQNAFTTTPLFIARMQTRAGRETSVVRSDNPTSTSIRLKIEEEQSKDSEIRHKSETVGYLAIGVNSETVNQP